MHLADKNSKYDQKRIKCGPVLTKLQVKYHDFIVIY